MEQGSLRDVMDDKEDNLNLDLRLKLLIDACKGM